MEIPLLDILESEIQIHIFQSIEVIAALYLIDGIPHIQIQFIPAQDGCGLDSLEGKHQLIVAAFVNDDPVAIQMEGSLLAQHILLLEQQNLGKTGGVPEQRLGFELSNI